MVKVVSLLYISVMFLFMSARMAVNKWVILVPSVNDCRREIPKSPASLAPDMDWLETHDLVLGTVGPKAPLDDAPRGGGPGFCSTPPIMRRMLRHIKSLAVRENVPLLKHIP